MKRWFVWLLMSAVLWGCASPGMKYETMPEAERNLEIRYELAGQSRDALFEKTLAWVKAEVVSGDGLLVRSDRAQGSMTAKVMTSYNSMWVEVPARYTMRVDFKDSRIRVVCYDFEDFWGEFKKTARPVEDADAMRQLKQKAQEKADALNAFLTGGTSSTDKDW